MKKYLGYKKPKNLVSVILRILVTMITGPLPVPAAGTCFSSSHHLKSSDTNTISSTKRDCVGIGSSNCNRNQYAKSILTRYGFKIIFKICRSIGPSERQTGQYIAVPQQDRMNINSHTGTDARLDSVSTSKLYYGLDSRKQCFAVESHDTIILNNFVT